MKLALHSPLILLSALLVVLITRRSWRSLPWFFSYSAFAVCADTGRFLTRDHPSVYFWTYWITEAIYDLLGVAVMYEVSRRVFGNLGRSWWPRLAFPAMIVVSFILTLGRGASVPSELHNRVLILIILGETFTRFLEVITFAALVTLVPLFGIQWRRHAFGIATGFGVYSTVALLTTTRFSVFGTKYYFFWNWSMVVSYSCAVLIWLFFFSAAEKAVPPHGSSVLTFEELNVYRKILRRINR